MKNTYRMWDDLDDNIVELTYYYETSVHLNVFDFK